MSVDKIIKETSLLQLFDLIREFCREMALGDNAEQCIRLKKSVENAGRENVIIRLPVILISVYMRNRR